MVYCFNQLSHGCFCMQDGRKRHLLRLWVAPEQDKPLAAPYAEQWGSTEIGNRGGMFIPGSVPTVPLEAE